jgi:CTP synthase (UTP-ammonia lyase)
MIDKAIKTVVEDKPRRSEILDVTKQLSKDLKKERKVYIAAVEDYLDLHQTYEAASEDFDGHGAATAFD